MDRVRGLAGWCGTELTTKQQCEGQAGQAIFNEWPLWQLEAAPEYCTDANPVMPLCCVVLQVLCACDRHFGDGKGVEEGDEKEELTEALAAASAVDEAAPAAAVA
jgi:hypothetical protein